MTPSVAMNLRADAILSSVRRLYLADWLARGVVLACLLVSIFASELIHDEAALRFRALTAAGGVGLTAEVVGWLLRLRARVKFVMARRLRRAAMIENGFGIDTLSEGVELSRGDDPSPIATEPYFGSDLPAGLSRFLENLCESAYFSGRLYEFSAVRSLPFVLAFLVAVAVFLAFSVRFEGLVGIALLAQVALAAASFVSGAELVERSLGWLGAAKECRRIATEAANLSAAISQPSPALAAWAITLQLHGDYSSTTLDVTPVPASLFKKKRAVINEEMKKWRTL